MTGMNINTGTSLLDELEGLWEAQGEAFSYHQGRDSGGTRSTFMTVNQDGMTGIQERENGLGGL